MSVYIRKHIRECTFKVKSGLSTLQLGYIRTLWLITGALPHGTAMSVMCAMVVSCTNPAPHLYANYCPAKESVSFRDASEEGPQEYASI